MVENRVDRFNRAVERSWPVLRTFLLVALRVVVAAVTSYVFIGYGYGFGGGAVSSYDQLARLGDGARNGFAGIWIPVLLSPLAALISLAISRRFAWIGPVLAMLASVVLAVYFATTFEQPEPLVGG
jgi:hypothetical protein